MDLLVESIRELFVIGPLYMFADLAFCVFTKADICYHFFMKGELVVCLQRNDRFYHFDF